MYRHPSFSMSASSLRICLHVAARAQREQPWLRIVYHARCAERPDRMLATCALRINGHCATRTSCLSLSSVRCASSLDRIFDFCLRVRSPRRAPFIVSELL
jgi:hypothetical protein